MNKMKIFSKSHVLFPSLGLFFLFSFYQVNGQMPLNLKAAMQYAVDNNSSVIQGKLDEAKGNINVEQLLSTGYPQINGNAQFVYNPLLQVIFFPDFLNGKPDDIRPVTIGTHWGTNASIEVTQLVFSPEFRVGLNAAKKATELYRSRAEATKEELVLQVSKGYYAIQAVKSQKANIQANLFKIKELLKLTKVQVENGLGRMQDVKQLELTELILENQLNNLELQIQQQMVMFKLSLQMPLVTDIILTDTLSESNYTLPEVVALQSNYNQRIGLKLIDQNQALNVINLNRYKASYWPTANLFANIAAQAQPRTFSDFVSSNSWASFSSVGLRLRVPIYDGGLRRTQVESVQIDIKKGEEDRKQILSLYEAQFENAKKTLALNLNNLTPLKRARNLAEEIYTQSQARYQQGLAPLTEILNAETSLRESKNNVLSALFQVRIAELDLLHANGQLIKFLQ
jgi:outer membrane protein TolC